MAIRHFAEVDSDPDSRELIQLIINLEDLDVLWPCMPGDLLQRRSHPDKWLALLCYNNNIRQAPALLIAHRAFCFVSRCLVTTLAAARKALFVKAASLVTVHSSTSTTALIRPEIDTVEGQHDNSDRVLSKERNNFIGRGNNNNNNNNNNSNSNSARPQNPPSRGNPSAASSPTSMAAPTLTGPASTSATEQVVRDNLARGKLPFFFREDYAGFVVKGNFMTLAAKPALVEEGEWVAHHVVEQARNLNNQVKMLLGDERTRAEDGICNPSTCPTMSAGITTYNWLDTRGNPINLPASTYIRNIIMWATGKVQDESLFPTATFTTAPPLPTPAQAASDPTHTLGKTSGFPQRFEAEVKNMYKQIFRCYAHLYWAHWLFFWDVNSYRELNTCFVHFVNVGRLFNLITEREMEPMMPLIDLWVRQGILPKFDKEQQEGEPSSTQAPGTANSA